MISAGADVGARGECKAGLQFSGLWGGRGAAPARDCPRPEGWRIVEAPTWIPLSPGASISTAAQDEYMRHQRLLGAFQPHPRSLTHPIPLFRQASVSEGKGGGACVAVSISCFGLVTLRRTELDGQQRDISRLRADVRKANAKQRKAQSFARAAETTAEETVAETEADRGVELRRLRCVSRNSKRSSATTRLGDYQARPLELKLARCTAQNNAEVTTRRLPQIHPSSCT
eukprot:6181995-Pleurochrysis_carterae.AAC.5